MMSWLARLQDLLSRGEDVVLVTMATVKGSAPREAGTRMLVSAEQSALTIGGGHLEYKALEIARQMLQQDRNRHEQQFSLGASLGQCCGGAVKLLFERLHGEQSWLTDAVKLDQTGQSGVLVLPLDADANSQRLLFDESGCLLVGPATLQQELSEKLITAVQQTVESRQDYGVEVITDAQGRQHRFLIDLIQPPAMQVYLFGAGHVGQALVQILGMQPCRIHWVETRDNQFPAETADNVLKLTTDTPEAEIAAAASGSYFLVMTHDHELDLRLSAEILKRDDFAYFGLIGSNTKRKRFEHRLLQRGYQAAQLSRMICPIGIDGIDSKLPAAIALAVSAQLLQIEQARQQMLQPDIKIYQRA